MPTITVEAGKMDKDKKSQLVRELTDISSKIMNVNTEAFTVIIKENDLDNIGVGGRLLSDVIKK